MLDKLFFAGVTGFLAGVLSRSFFVFPLSYALGVVGVGFCFSLIRRFGVLHFIPPIFIIAIAACGIGMMRFDMADATPDSRLAVFTDSRIGLVATIVREPDVREKNTLLTLGDIALGIDASGEKVTGRILVRAPHYPEFSYGDRLSVSGILKRPEPFATDGGRQFDYPAFLSKDGIYFILNTPRIELVGVGQGNVVLASLIKIKQAFLARIRQFVPAPEEGLLAGIVFGEQSGISKTLSEDFRKSGLVHVVVLSGYNLSVVADWIMRAVAFLPRVAGLSLGALGIILYTLMAGASATAVRAALMALLVVLAQGTRRRYNVSRALIIAGLCMVLANPKVLVFDRSFQLSFLATIAVIYVSPLFEKKLPFITERLGFRGIIATTIATQITVLPFLLYTSGTLSLLSLPANILVLPVVPAAMFAGFATGVFGFISATLTIPVALITTALHSWIIAAAHYFASAPLSGIVIPAFPFAWVIAAYVVLGILVVRARRGKVVEKGIDNRV